ncbi:MAG: acyl CoA:acetate/3-ketoacid CoA transferase, partial [Roseibium sp.]|nr:acyl CoA:acetate/3-ketoacid CoA transferase [Roseibium sp.]
CGGFVDITANAKKIVFSGLFEAGADLELTDEGLTVKSPGKFTKMVDEVEHVTFSGRRARDLGQDVTYITERCVIQLTDSGLIATEIMPGIDPGRDIVDASMGRIRLANTLKEMPKALLRNAPMELSL